MIRAIRSTHRQGSGSIYLSVCISVGNVLPILAATEAVGASANAGLLQDFAVDTGVVFG
jgi:hypothetical protein